MFLHPPEGAHVSSPPEGVHVSSPPEGVHVYRPQTHKSPSHSVRSAMLVVLWHLPYGHGTPSGVRRLSLSWAINIDPLRG
jgi:hypothetical protein